MALQASRISLDDDGYEKPNFRFPYFVGQQTPVSVNCVLIIQIAFVIYISFWPFL